MVANSREMYGKGFTYVITRRIIQRKDSTVLRVRVVAYKGTDGGGGIPEKNEYRDYTSIALGDAKFADLIAQVERHIRH